MLDDRLLIWNWKTGVLHVNMVRAPLTELFTVNPLGEQKHNNLVVYSRSK
jgi:hypothetical protein